MNAYRNKNQFSMDEITFSNPKLNLKMKEQKLSVIQIGQIKKNMRLEKARLHEKKKRANLDFEIKMLVAERNAYLAVLDDLSEEVAILRKKVKSFANVNVEATKYCSHENAVNSQTYMYNSFVCNCNEHCWFGQKTSFNPINLIQQGNVSIDHCLNESLIKSSKMDPK